MGQFRSNNLWPLALVACISSMFLCSGITLPVLPVQRKKTALPQRASSGQLMEKLATVTLPRPRTNYLVWDSGDTNTLPVGVDYGFRVYAKTNLSSPWRLYTTINIHSNHVVLQIDNTNKVEFFRVAAIVSQ